MNDWRGRPHPSRGRSRRRRRARGLRSVNSSCSWSRNLHLSITCYLARPSCRTVNRKRTIISIRESILNVQTNYAIANRENLINLTFLSSHLYVASIVSSYCQLYNQLKKLLSSSLTLKIKIIYYLGKLFVHVLNFNYK